MSGDSGVAGEGRVASIPKFLSRGKHTVSMPLRTINSDWMSNASSGCALFILYYAGPSRWQGQQTWNPS